MKNIIQILVALFAVVFFSCTGPSVSKEQGNPLLSEYKTPFQVPPFDKIQNAHFKPALDSGIVALRTDIEAIISNPEDPDFENTIEALEYSGMLLDRVQNVFGNLRSANTNDSIQLIAKEMAPEISKVYDDIYLNQQLFERVNKVYNGRTALDLSPEQEKLLEETYKTFVRRGANLPADAKEQLRSINEQLSLLTLEFGENILTETNNFQMVVEDEAQLAGLPENVIKSGAEAASEEGMDGKWLFTVHKPSMLPFLQYSEVRPLREKLFKAYMNLGNNNNEYDNKEVLKKMVNLRIDRANLLGYESHADYVLADRMAENPENVYDLITEIWTSALPVAKKEAELLQEMIYKEGHDFKLQPWDWWYYAEKVRKAEYDLDEEQLRPYFKLENVREGVFGLANRLFGLTFEEIRDIPKPHPDANAFEVKEEDGSHVGILFMDFHPRQSKRGGAWMSSYRKQYQHDGEYIHPVITNVCNFSKPTGNKPALLSLDEVHTLFHEFGHALHGLLSDCTYPSLSGTAVPRDFVELPSQIMENWVLEPELLKSYAKHYETGEVIPDSLISKIKESALFNQGFAMAEYLAASFLDMDYHTLTEPLTEDVLAFEMNAMDEIGLIDEIIPRYRSTYFRHIFASGYSAGYYSYIWAEVLDADAYEAFKENGIFDKETARAFRENILARGGTQDPMMLYKQFRGDEPNINALLKRKGLVKKSDIKGDDNVL